MAGRSVLRIASYLAMTAKAVLNALFLAKGPSGN
jgi:hypothetical protein